MGRAPCCDKASVKKGPWSPEEDAKLKNFIEKFGTGGNWIALPQKAGLKRCGKSCRLRWLNYLRPNIKHGEFTEEEDRIICSLYATIGSRWSIIAAQLPGRTDNDIKNYWNTKLKKKLLGSAPNHGKRNQLHYQQLHQQQQQELHFPNSLQLPQLSRALDHFNNPATSNSSLLQSPSYLDYEAKPSIDVDRRMNMIVFGNNDQRSCTTSDHNNNMPPLESYLYNNNSGAGDHHQSHNLSTGMLTWGTDQAPLEYNYDEIKQLLQCSNYNTTLCCNTTSSISTSASCTPTSSSCVILPDDIPGVEGLKLVKPELGKMYQF